MNKTITTFVLAVAFVATATLAPLAHAVEATSTATTTTSVATTTVATTTVATSTPASSTTIAGLLAQLAKLTALFNELKAKLAGTQAEIKELRGDIREGMSDADVKTIQELLASDSSIYPGGLVTGYFGPMTKEAIKRFQARNGLEVTGEIDTETKAAMDAIIEARRAEGKFPVGLLLAPGVKDKFEHRLKMRCANVTASSTTSVPTCEKIKAKYKFEVDDKGRIKMESKMEMKKNDDRDDEMDDSNDDEDDDSNDDDEDDDSNDDSDDDNDDDNDDDSNDDN